MTILNSLTKKLLGKTQEVSSGSAPGGMSAQPMTTSEKRDAATGLKVTINPIPKAERLYSEFGFVPTSPALLHKIIENSGEKFITADELKTLRELQVLFEKIHEFKMAHTSEAARQIFKQQARDASAAIALGKTDSVKGLDFAEKQELQNDFAVKLNLAKTEQRKLSAQAVPFVHEIARRIGAAAREQHDQLLAEEQKRYADFGLPFVPSKLLVTLGQFSWRSEELVGASPGSSPKLMLAHVGITL